MKVMMKEFTVRNGKGLIRLVTDDWSEALVIEKAVAVKWPDCGGSIAEYFALTPYPSAKQQELAAAIEAGLAATDEQEVLDGVGGFLELFENATYSVRLRSFSRPYILIFDHVDPLTGRAEPGSRFMANCYPEDLPTFVFTRSMDSVDRDRVAHYAKLIGGGARPRALVYRLESENCETADFILDGHHKALAYDQLGLELPVVHIACTSARPVPQQEQHAHVRTLLDPEGRPGVNSDVVTRLRKGHWVITGEIDLHGLRRDEARDQLAAFVRNASRRGQRCLRVVHGKGHGSPGREPVLKGKVQRWLAQCHEVIAFTQARGAEGGAGALVVLLSG